MKPVVHAAGISVVGLAEVVAHLPRIYREYRKLVNYARGNSPSAALLTDNPDFNLRLAAQLKRLGVPVFYLVAPQVWAWRQGRVKKIRRLVDKLFCLFPFEEPWFRERGVDATYIGHPLARVVRPSKSRTEFFVQHGVPADRAVVVLLPGSRGGEIERHLPVLLETTMLLRKRLDVSVILATSKGYGGQSALAKFTERIAAASIQVIENETWDCIAHSNLALAASGTVTMEAAVLGTPMVTFYKVNPLTWYGGRHLVKVPFLSMVNLIAGRSVVPELIQHDMTPARLTNEAEMLLLDCNKANAMRQDLAHVKEMLTPQRDPFCYVADFIAANVTRGAGTITPVELDLVRETMK